jgi:hypothetical protein
MKVGSPGGLARESPSCRLACGRRACAGALSEDVVRNRVSVPVYIERGKQPLYRSGWSALRIKKTRGGPLGTRPICDVTLGQKL